MGASDTLGFLAMDDASNVVIWSDLTNQSISYAYVEQRSAVLGYYQAWETGYRKQLVYEGYVRVSMCVYVCLCVCSWYTRGTCVYVCLCVCSWYTRGTCVCLCVSM